MTVAGEKDVGSKLSTSAKIISGFIICLALCSLFLPIRYFFFYNENYFRQIWAHYTYVPDQAILSTPLYGCFGINERIFSERSNFRNLFNRGNGGYTDGQECLMGFHRSENYDRVVGKFSYVPTALTDKLRDDYKKEIISIKNDSAYKVTFTAYVHPDYPEVYAILDNSLPSLTCHLRSLISLILCGGMSLFILRWVAKFTKSVLRRSQRKNPPPEQNPA